MPTAVAIAVKKDSEAELSGRKSYDGLTTLTFMVAVEIGASCTVHLLKQVTTFCNNPNRGFCHILGDFILFYIFLKDIKKCI